MIKNINESIVYVGTDDHDIDLFEGMYDVPDGVSYNSYVILDEKITVMDTVDERKTDEWLKNVKEALNGKNPSYLVVQHMEPDHSASIEAFLNVYPETEVVGNVKTFKMISQFFPKLEIKNKKTVADGESLEIGSHILNFVFAPMVHWPEVMLTYESSEKILFSADAFGKFGALDVEDEWDCEARRYYFGIVGKYGKMVQNLLKKAAALEINTICPLHGPVLTENLGHYIDLYDKWSKYEAENNGICVCYASVYGNTKKAAELLCNKLEEYGAPAVICIDLARCDMSEAVEDAFRYDSLVLASITYNGDVFPRMKTFISNLTERSYQNRRIGYIENGSWAPTAARVMREAFKNSVNMTEVENNITITSALNDAAVEKIDALAKELVAKYN